MTAANGILAHAREKVRGQALFSVEDFRELHEAAKDGGFSPDSHPADFRIEQLLRHHFGPRWRKITLPVPMVYWTESERQAIEAAEAVVSEKRAIYGPAHDRWWDLERLSNAPPPGSTIEQQIQLNREVKTALESYREARRHYENALAELTSLKAAAQWRRQREQLELSTKK